MDNFWWGVAAAAIAIGVIRLFVDDVFDFIGGCFVAVFVFCFVVLIFSGAVVLFKSAFLG